jgi:hypothetical protein
VLTTWLSAVDLVNVAMSLLAENEPDRFAGLTVRVELPSVIEEIDASQSSSSLQVRSHLAAVAWFHLLFSSLEPCASSSCLDRDAILHVSG